ncbi:MAG: hypothetical protein ACK56I_28750, partial [bacterium]
MRHFGIEVHVTFVTRLPDAAVDPEQHRTLLVGSFLGAIDIQHMPNITVFTVRDVFQLLLSGSGDAERKHEQC